MSHLKRLGNQFTIRIQPDQDGLLGRECPVVECGGYFKIQPGTGLTGENLPCHCPYCGHTADPSEFYTREQIEYAKSVVLNQVTGALLKDLKAMEFDHRPPRGSFGIGMSLKVEGRPVPIRYYREKQLETEVVCDQCTLRYAIYGVFGYCPDCGTHNSLQILEKNLEVAAKEVALAATVETTLSESLIADALENAVSAFDGFGRESCRVGSSKALAPDKAENISFQNLSGARKRVQELFGFDLAATIEPIDWASAQRDFQKRHLIAHKMGVIDETYLNAANDPQAVLGRKVKIEPDEVVALIEILRKIGTHLVLQLSK